tara:strand:+ start:540 stop:653 length:114 start_codon:yes stop_codon:yes gene_type:complete
MCPITLISYFFAGGGGGGAGLTPVDADGLVLHPLFAP